MAITAHFITRPTPGGKLVLHSEVIALRYVAGSHTGTNLGAHFFQVLADLGIISKVRTCTTIKPCPVPDLLIADGNDNAGQWRKLRYNAR